MIKFASGFLSALIALAAGTYIFLISGGIPLETRHAPFAIEEWGVEKAMAAHLNGTDKISPPFAVNEVHLLEGAKIYSHHCAICHGGHSGDTPPIAKTMFPAPPQLLKEGSWEVGYPPGSVHKLIQGGIRLSGMPAFASILNERELWQVSLMLVHADRLPPDAIEVLASK